MNIRLLNDMILVRPDPEPEQLGLIVPPVGALPQGHQPSQNPVTFLGIEQRVGSERDTFTGTVVATGPGDKFRERMVHNKLIRKLINPDGSRAPMRTKVGDRVMYPRRPSSPVGTDPGTGNCDIFLEGERYVMFHEEQYALAIIEQ